MATSQKSGNRLGLSGKQNALLDNIALMFLPWFTAMHFGVLTTNLTIFGGFDFAGSLWSVAGISISVALIAIIFALAWILATNELDGADYDPWEFGVIAFTLLSPVVYVVVPAFESLVMWNGYSQLMWTVAVTAAATYIGYSN